MIILLKQKNFGPNVIYFALGITEGRPAYAESGTVSGVPGMAFPIPGHGFGRVRAIARYGFSHTGIEFWIRTLGPCGVFPVWLSPYRGRVWGVARYGFSHTGTKVLDPDSRYGFSHTGVRNDTF